MSSVSLSDAIEMSTNYFARKLNSVIYSSKMIPVWTTKDGRQFWHEDDIDDEHLRNIVNTLIQSVGSEQFLKEFTTYSILIGSLKKRGLWTEADELRSRLEGVVDRRSRA